MIPVDELARMILHSPVLSHIRYRENDGLTDDIVSNYIQPAVDRVVLSYEWDFALATADKAIVANQRDYTLTGNVNDCRQIFNVRYGTGTPDDGYSLLRKFTPAAFDRFISERDVSGVFGWLQQDRDGKFPVVRIVDTPSDASKSLRYRYWKAKIGYGELPEDSGFDLLVMDAVIEELAPDQKMVKRFETKLHEVISTYQPPGGEDDPLVLDPYTRFRNNKRNQLYGYAGGRVYYGNDD